MSSNFHVKISIDPDTREGIAVCSHLELLRNHFSCVNESATYAMRKRGSKRQIKSYLISENGRFPIGYLNEIYAWAKNLRGTLQKDEFEVSSEARYFYEPKFQLPDRYELFQFDGFPYRDIQEDGLHRCLTRGRGIVDVGTGGGKGLMMAGIIKTTSKYNPSLNYLIICQAHLVVKTVDEFKEDYGFTEDQIRPWCSGEKPTFEEQVVVASSSILTEKNLEKVINRNVVLIDECHIVKNSSQITKQIKRLKANNIIGFTGTVPYESEQDRWSVLGNVGKIIYTVSSSELKEKGYKSASKVVGIGFQGSKYKTQFFENDEEGNQVERDKGEVFKEEEEYVLRNESRNQYIKRFLENVTTENTLIPIDYDYHEEILRELLADFDRPVYFINGQTPQEERTRIYNQLESDSESILVVKTGIMREGISIKNLSFMVSFFAKKSFIRIIQLIGRIERISERKTPVFFDFYDDSRKSFEHFQKRKEYYEHEKIPVVEKMIELEY